MYLFMDWCFSAVEIVQNLNSCKADVLIYEKAKRHIIIDPLNHCIKTICTYLWIGVLVR